MKVVCESCQAKYQVPDERVAGKKLKIRCKRCGATVLIRGDLAQPAAASGGESVPPASVPPIHVSEAAPALEWHVSRDGDTRGPFETEELRAWLSSEPGGWDVHVWREGFPDWIEARSCAELGAPLLATQRRARTRLRSESRRRRSDADVRCRGSDRRSFDGAGRGFATRGSVR